MTDKYVSKLSFHVLKQLVNTSIKRLRYDCCFYKQKNSKLYAYLHTRFIVKIQNCDFIFNKIHSGQKCLLRVACLWSKMPMFQRAGMREGGKPLPLAFQYLIFMV